MTHSSTNRINHINPHLEQGDWGRRLPFSAGCLLNLHLSEKPALVPGSGATDSLKPPILGAAASPP